MAADRDQQHVDFPQRRELRIIQLVPQVAQVRHALPLGLDDVDRVFPAQQAALVVMEAVDRGHAERGLLPGERHRSVIAVVPVTVAAEHRVRLQRRQRYPGHRARRVGVENNGALRRLQQKAGMSQPGEFHCAAPPVFFFSIAKRRGLCKNFQLTWDFPDGRIDRETKGGGLP